METNYIKAIKNRSTDHSSPTLSLTPEIRQIPWAECLKIRAPQFFWKTVPFSRNPPRKIIFESALVGGYLSPHEGYRLWNPKKYRSDMFRHLAVQLLKKSIPTQADLIEGPDFSSPSSLTARALQKAFPKGKDCLLNRSHVQVLLLLISIAVFVMIILLPSSYMGIITDPTTHPSQGQQSPWAPQTNHSLGWSTKDTWESLADCWADVSQQKSGWMEEMSTNASWACWFKFYWIIISKYSLVPFHLANHISTILILPLGCSQFSFPYAPKKSPLLGSFWMIPQASRES